MEFLNQRKSTRRGYTSGKFRPSLPLHDDLARTREKKAHTLNFEKYAAEGNRFIKEVAYEMGVDRQEAARMTRAILHALRDRLPPIDAVQFAQGLPMALKGIYLDRYDIAKCPVKIRHDWEFLDYIAEKAERSPGPEGRHYRHDSLVAVIAVLERTMDRQQIRHVARMLNLEIRDLFY
jgi:uncharacterized protein (DUF2267 family)